MLRLTTSIGIASQAVTDIADRAIRERPVWDSHYPSGTLLEGKRALGRF
jgi:hypothetical protein